MLKSLNMKFLDRANVQASYQFILEVLGMKIGLLVAIGYLERCQVIFEAIHNVLSKMLVIALSIMNCESG